MKDVALSVTALSKLKSALRAQIPGSSAPVDQAFLYENCFAKGFEFFGAGG